MKPSLGGTNDSCGSFCRSFCFMATAVIVLTLGALSLAALIRMMLTGPPPPGPPWGTSRVDDPRHDERR
jgi:hypothetical protein